MPRAVEFVRCSASDLQLLLVVDTLLNRETKRHFLLALRRQKAAGGEVGGADSWRVEQRERLTSTTPTARHEDHTLFDRLLRRSMNDFLLLRGMSKPPLHRHLHSHRPLPTEIGKFCGCTLCSSRSHSAMSSRRRCTSVRVGRSSPDCAPPADVCRERLRAARRAAASLHRDGRVAPPVAQRASRRLGPSPVRPMGRAAVRARGGRVARIRQMAEHRIGRQCSLWRRRRASTSNAA